MFTGIILAIGKIAAIERRQGDCRLKIETGTLALSDCVLGDSIAVDGVCLTAVELGSAYFCADVSNETLARTTLGSIVPGSRVNLELALTPSTRIGGHIVSGHVDGIGHIVDRKKDARSIRFKIKVPDHLSKYIVEKGSICVNGISLTVNSIQNAVFDINIVPHTLEKTTLNQATAGTQVNVEVDLLARYLESLLQHQTTTQSNGITENLLQRSGFFEQSK